MHLQGDYRMRPKIDTKPLRTKVQIEKLQILKSYALTHTLLRNNGMDVVRACVYKLQRITILWPHLLSKACVRMKPAASFE